MARTKEKATKLTASRSKSAAPKNRRASSARAAKGSGAAAKAGKARSSSSSKSAAAKAKPAKRKKAAAAAGNKAAPKAAAKKAATKSAARRAAPKAAAKKAVPERAAKKAVKQRNASSVKKAPKAAKPKQETRATPAPKPAAVSQPVRPPKRRAARPLPPPPPAVPDRQAQQEAKLARQLEQRQSEQYEKAVAYFNERRFSRAHSLFVKAAEGPNVTLRHRAQVYADICQQQIGNERVHLKTAEDHYNYAVKLMNDRRLDEAEQHVQRALKLAPKAGYVHYASAVLSALQGNPEAAFGNLKRAIEIDPLNRVLALNDADLASIVGHPPIAKLLHQG